MNYELVNKNLTAMISSHGAELKSLKRDGHEYIWQADPEFWGRSTPVLFPLVGSVKNKEFRAKGQTFTMGQHGFARDAEFTLVEKGEDFVTLRLQSDAETLLKYPYEFVLDITHTLKENGLQTTWKVTNPATEDLHFSVGGHPAFNCATEGWSLCLHDVTTMDYHLLLDGGIIGNTSYHMNLVNGLLPITQEQFAKDALILPDAKTHCVGLVNPDGREVLQVSFETNILGLWSPAGKNAPFVCIEPWYGTADWEDADGEWEHRRFANVLAPKEEFTGGYTIVLK